MSAGTQAAQAVKHQGHHIVPGLWSPAECRRLRGALDELWRRMRGGACSGDFGFIIHPLLPRMPGLIDLYTRPEVVEMLSAILDDEPRLAHNGALISDHRRTFTPWHYHRNDSYEPQVWDPSRAERPGRIQRVLAQVYLDGSNPEVGELLLVPRAVDDPLAPPRVDPQVEWPEQVVVQCPPGSLVIFDQSVFHAARGGACPERRHLVGGHYQGWSDATPHREDNLALSRSVAAAATANPLLARLLLPPEPVWS